MDNTQLITQLGQIIGSAKNVAILTHTNPDQDAIASMACLQTILNGLNVKSQLFYDGLLNNPQVIQMMMTMNLSLVQLTDFQSQVANFDTKIVVDTQAERLKFFGIQYKNLGVNIDMAIDHHCTDPNLPFNIPTIHYDCASTCSILVTVMQQLNYMSFLNPSLAAVMMVGILDDSYGLINQTISEMDILAYNQLNNVVDKQLLRSLSNYKQPKSWLYAKKLMYSSVDTSGGNIIIGNLGNVSWQDIHVLRDASNELLQIQGFDYAAVYCNVEPNKIFGLIKSYMDSTILKAICKTLGQSTGISGVKPIEGSYQHVPQPNENETQRILSVFKGIM